MSILIYICNKYGIVANELPLRGREGDDYNADARVNIGTGRRNLEWKSKHKVM